MLQHAARARGGSQREHVIGCGACGRSEQWRGKIRGVLRKNEVVARDGGGSVAVDGDCAYGAAAAAKNKRGRVPLRCTQFVVGERQVPHSVFARVRPLRDCRGRLM